MSVRKLRERHNDINKTSDLKKRDELKNSGERGASSDKMRFLYAVELLYVS